MGLVTEKRESFRNGLRTDFYRTATFDVENIKLFEEAVKSGYGDAKRTFDNIGEFWKDKESEKQQFFTVMAENIQKIFKEAVSAHWHDDLCQLFCKELTNLGYHPIVNGREKITTYGQAQKVINMAFKYLYCIEGAQKYHNIFAKCHMPLDSYTLSWYRKVAGKNAEIKADTKWSSLTKELYVNIQTEICKFLQEGQFIQIDSQSVFLPKYPLDAELIIWPEEILLKAGNDFAKTLDPSFKKRDSDSMQLMKDILHQQLPQHCNLDMCICKKQ